MKRVCDKCNIDMIEECNVISYSSYKVVVCKKKTGFFLDEGEPLKAAVCPKCGNTCLYIDNYNKFVK
ncbi:nucleic acid-binding protein [Clostridioides difficile]